jgi:protocatechuate 3,4-dioxygenase beta subunit
MRATANVLSTALFLLSLQSYLSGQSATGSVSGTATVDGKPASGVTIVLSNRMSRVRPSKSTAVTDDEGRFRLSGVPVGNYNVEAQSAVLIPAPAEPGSYQQEVAVVQGSAIEGIEIQLVRGAVITGKVTGADGNPVVGRALLLRSANKKPFHVSRSIVSGRTDDRGVYRFYGVTPGSYLIGISPSGGPSFYGGSENDAVFYPNATSAAEAKPVQVAEGEEKTGIDIALGEVHGVEVSGQVIDDQTGMAMAGVAVVYGTMTTTPQGTQQMRSIQYSSLSDRTGRFYFPGVSPGHYSAFVRGMEGGPAGYSDPVDFDVSDSKVTNLVVRVRAGATVRGMVVLNDPNDQAAAAALGTLQVYLNPIGNSTPMGGVAGQVNGDGSFQIKGAAPGKARISIFSREGLPNYSVLRVQEGTRAVNDSTINIAADGNVEPVAIVVAYGSGSISGTVRLTNGGSLAGLKLRLVAKWLGAQTENGMPRTAAQVDARGNFFLERLVPGSYEIAFYTTSAKSGAAGQQTVIVNKGQVTQVTCTIDPNTLQQ